MVSIVERTRLEGGHNVGRDSARYCMHKDEQKEDEAQILGTGVPVGRAQKKMGPRQLDSQCWRVEQVPAGGKLVHKESGSKSEETAHILTTLGEHPIDVLNIGFGLGIIGTLFQSLPVPPATHTMVEPHPDVLQRMKEHSWYQKPGVKILECSTKLLFYDVYSHLAELHLDDVGVDVQWKDVNLFNERVFSCAFVSTSGGQHGKILGSIKYQALLDGTVLVILLLRLSIIR
ncbi:hypothetical protein BDP27DRAFT_1362447 [Rhodocollybia butyracea]|uniref:Uncharacterized protein n=1 Tax=Rhodocollybia butyracea TaxID=206335 RepID=A0A9P5U922_9AGAR|nr:hypothetical protein BDP27DRAFT_1362447 [Rhodocollybia butyracea]